MSTQRYNNKYCKTIHNIKSATVKHNTNNNNNNKNNSTYLSKYA